MFEVTAVSFVSLLLASLSGETSNDHIVSTSEFKEAESRGVDVNLASDGICLLR